MMTEIEVATGTKCDFCNDPKIAWDYPARSYNLAALAPVVPEGVARSLDAWAACETCHGLIQSGNWRGLAERSVEKFKVSFGIDIPIEIVMGMHQEFRANWLGPARKVEDSK